VVRWAGHRPLASKGSCGRLRSDVQRLRGARIMPCQTHRFGQDRRTDRAGQSRLEGNQKSPTTTDRPRCPEWLVVDGWKARRKKVKQWRRQGKDKRSGAGISLLSFPPSKGPYARFSIPLHPGRINHQAFSLSRLCAHKHSSAQQYMIIISHLLRLL